MRPDVVFESTAYPYTLTVPGGVLDRNWTAAKVAWDGSARIDMAGNLVDRSGTPEGGLFVFGGPAPEGLDAFTGTVAGLFQRFHGCGEPKDQRDIAVGGVAGKLWVQDCAQNTTFVRAALVKDGLGLVAFMSPTPASRDVAGDRLVEILSGLEWRTP